MIKTIKTTLQPNFENEVNELLDKGFILKSCSCNTYQSDGYDEETYWTAILEEVS